MGSGQKPLKISIQASPPDSPESAELLRELDGWLESLYPPESRHDLSGEALQFYVLRCGEETAACGGLVHCTDYAELKRIYVRPTFRGLGLAERLVRHLEQVAFDLGFTRMRLETGSKQTAAVRLYEKLGYLPIPAFGAYLTDPHSLCFEKGIGPAAPNPGPC